MSTIRITKTRRIMGALGWPRPASLLSGPLGFAVGRSR